MKLTMADFRAFLETIPREFLVAMADTAEREDRIEILEREAHRLRLALLCTCGVRLSVCNAHVPGCRFLETT